MPCQDANRCDMNIKGKDIQIFFNMLQNCYTVGLFKKEMSP